MPKGKNESDISVLPDKRFNFNRKMQFLLGRPHYHSKNQGSDVLCSRKASDQSNCFDDPAVKKRRRLRCYLIRGCPIANTYSTFGRTLINGRSRARRSAQRPTAAKKKALTLGAVDSLLRSPGCAAKG